MKELKTISDEKLLRQIQSGNDDAMECLLERYRDMVRKEARSFFLAGGDEEDLIQEDARKKRQEDQVRLEAIKQDFNKQYNVPPVRK